MAKGSFTLNYDTEDFAATLKAAAVMMEEMAARHTAIPAVVAAPQPVIAHLAEPEFTDYGKFYDFLRGNSMLGPNITTPVFNGCNAIILACQNAKWGISWTAYALGTAYWETAHTMQPVKEIGGDAYYTRMYDIKGNRPAKAKELGNLTPGDGKKYPGMGYVQMTGLKNFKRATEKLRALGFDVDLVAHPELAMRPDVAAAIMVLGMEEGWFTTRKLGDDLPKRGPASLRQFVLSRDIINGTDKDDEIAACAVQFQSGLALGGYREL
jgi:putative chitinase